MTPPQHLRQLANLPPRPAHAHDSDARAPLWGAHGTANQGTGEAAAIMGARTRGSLEPAPGRARDPHRIACVYACPTPLQGGTSILRKKVAVEARVVGGGGVVAWRRLSSSFFFFLERFADFVFL